MEILAMYDTLAIGLSDLLEQQARDPDGQFCLLLLTDGNTNTGIRLENIREVLKYSSVRFYPIACGDVDQYELETIAATREGSVYTGDPKSVQALLKNLFQTQL